MAKSYVALSLNRKVKVIAAKEKDKLSVQEIESRKVRSLKPIKIY
jgi:hypothetical protein